MINRVYLEVLSTRSEYPIFKRDNFLCMPFDFALSFYPSAMTTYIVFRNDLAEWCEKNVLNGYFYLIEGRILVYKKKWVLRAVDSKELLRLRGLVIEASSIFKSSRKTLKQTRPSEEEKKMKPNKRGSALITTEYELLKKETKLFGFAKTITDRISIYEKLRSVGITSMEDDE